jgi:hypothetical protein
MTPIPLADLVAADPIGTAKAAMRARLATLLPGVTIVAHPGKIDISEVVGRSVVAAPGVALGWSRIRAARIIDGSWSAAVEWTAYVVVEDMSIAGRRVERERLGLAIGGRVVAILEDAGEQTWGLGNILPPEADPRPELKPMFTVRDLTQGTAYYAVTWTQTLIDLGRSLFAGETPTLTLVDPQPTQEIDVQFSADDAIPPEVLALLRMEDGDG